MGEDPQKKSEAFRQADIKIEFGSGKSLSAFFDEAGGVRSFPHELSDDSLLVLNEDVEKVLKKQIKRYAIKTRKKINFDLDSFEQLPEGELIHIPSTDISFIKCEANKALVQISGLTEPISFRLPAKIVFEHLAGLSYNLAMESEFDRIRDWIKEGGENKYVMANYPLKPEKPRSLDYRPYHYIKFDYSDGCLVALIGLFGILKFSVFLCEIPYAKLSIIHEIMDYYHVYDLYNKTTFFSEGNKDMLDEEKLFASGIIAFGKYKHSR